MEKVLEISKIVIVISIFFLVGTGLQWFVISLVSPMPFNFQNYGVFNWIIQIAYWLILICGGLVINSEE